MSEIKNIELLPLHPNQQRIIDEAKRFNVLKCGRRFGKTTLCEELITFKLLIGQPVAYYCPTYKDLFNVWIRIKQILHEAITFKDETVKQLRIHGGGMLDMWSLEDPDSGRGRKYGRVIIDEAEKARYLELGWKQTIRATLTDLKGDAWFLSTPKFGNTYFKKLATYAEVSDNWASWTFTSFDNPFIDPTEIEQAKNQLDEATFRCEFLADNVDFSINKFIHCFKRDKHIVEGLQSIPYQPIILSFDFNVEPITCLVCQHIRLEEVRILDEYRLMNSDIYELCGRIKADYGDRMLIVTGDASGRNRTALKANLNYYKVIRDELKLGSGQFVLPLANPPIKTTRVLCNSLLSRHKNFSFSDRVPHLIVDLESCEVNDNGDLDKTKDAHKGHLLDCFRYFCFNFLNKFIELKIIPPPHVEISESVRIW